VSLLSSKLVECIVLLSREYADVDSHFDTHNQDLRQNYLQLMFRKYGLKLWDNETILDTFQIHEETSTLEKLRQQHRDAQVCTDDEFANRFTIEARRESGVYSVCF
jgi:hypothetical protein